MLQYLFSPTKQFTYDSGKLLDAGQIYVYIQDTTDLATLYDDNGDYVSNPIILDVNGRASVKADDTYEYRLEVYDCFGVLQFTCTAFYGGEGGGGTFIVRHDDTLSGNGTSQSLLGVVNIPLAVDETMTAYEDEVSGENALILGVNGDWFGETFSSYYNNKVDLSSFNELSGIVNDKADASALNNYYTKDETNNLFQPQSAMGDYYLKTQTSSDVELANAFANIPGGEGTMKTSLLEYNDADEISGYDGSAFATGGDSNFSGLFEAVYGQTTYNDIRDAVNDKKIVYCRISPAGASRMAFLAYGGSNNYEFQYYRSLTGHTTANQGDEVYVYTVASTGWASAMRKTYTQIVPGTNVQSAYNTSQGKLTLNVSGAFPMINGGYTADCDGSAFKISTTTSTLTLSENGATYASYPSTHIDATWTQILAKAKEPQYVPTVSSYTFVVNSEVDVQYSAVEKVNEITFIAASWGNFLNYSANFKDGNTNKGTLVIPSGKVMTATKNWNWEDNGFRWNKKLQDGTLMPM